MLLRVVAVLAATFVLGRAELTAAEEEASHHFDPLDAHGGIFRALPWTDFELAKVSSYHATADYHRIMQMVRMKLIETPELETHARKRIEHFLKEKRPPSFLRHMLTEDQREQIRDHHLSGELSEAMDIMIGALRRLTTDQYHTAMRYFGFEKER